MKRLAHIALVLVLVATGLSMPLSAHADTFAVQTMQVLPVGGNSCPQLQVDGVTPYIYDSSLHSFDVTIADSSYVSVIGSAGDTGAPFNQMTRNDAGAGHVRIHVDITATPIYGSLPVSITLLSSAAGKPTCLSTVSFTVLGNAQQPSTPVKQPVKTPVTTPTGSATTSPATSTVATPATTTPPGAVTGTTIGERLGRMCATNSSLQLWLLLITLYLLAVAVVALAEPPLYKKREWLPGALIAGPLALLLAAWLFIPACRGEGWMPLLLLFIAIVGTLIAYRNDGITVKRVFQLPQTPSTPVSNQIAARLKQMEELSSAKPASTQTPPKKKQG